MCYFVLYMYVIFLSVFIYFLLFVHICETHMSLGGTLSDVWKFVSYIVSCSYITSLYRWRYAPPQNCAAPSADTLVNNIFTMPCRPHRTRALCDLIGLSSSLFDSYLIETVTIITSIE